MFHYYYYYPLPAGRPEIISCEKIGGILNLAGVVVRAVYELKIRYPNGAIDLAWQLADLEQIERNWYTGGLNADPGSAGAGPGAGKVLSKILHERPEFEVAWDNRKQKYYVV